MRIYSPESHLFGVEKYGAVKLKFYAQYFVQAVSMKIKMHKYILLRNMMNVRNLRLANVKQGEELEINRL